MNTLEMTEELLMEELFPADEAVFKEAWPLPEEETVKEFEEYLLDIGVRI